MSESGENPPIQLPKKPDTHYDTTGPEAAPWWEVEARENTLLKPEFNLLTVPPEYVDDFADWAGDMLRVHSQRQWREWRQAEIDFAKQGLINTDLNSPQGEITPTHGAALLYRYARALKTWNRWERDTKYSEADKINRFGQLLGLDMACRAVGLETDRKYLESVFKRMQGVDGSKIRQRYNSIKAGNRTD